MNKKATIATLGPEDSNHGYIARRYCMARQFTDVNLLFCHEFTPALDAIEQRDADYILICGVHPECGHVVGRGKYAMDLEIVDMFIAESQPLAILTRDGVVAPISIALQPATESYTDLSAWTQRTHVTSTVAAAEGLINGKWDSALTLRKFIKRPGLRLDREIPPPRDPWLILCRSSTDNPLKLTLHPSLAVRSLDL